MDSAAVVGWSLLAFVFLLGLALIPLSRRSRRVGGEAVGTRPAGPKTTPPKTTPPKSAPPKAVTRTAPPVKAPPAKAPPSKAPTKGAPPRTAPPRTAPSKAAPSTVVPPRTVPPTPVRAPAPADDDLIEAPEDVLDVEAPETEAPELEEPEVEEPELEEPEEPDSAPAAELERPAPTAGRLVRLRARLSRSQNVFGKGLLALLSRDKLDEDTWEEIEETLITADVGRRADPPDRRTAAGAGPGARHRDRQRAAGASCGRSSSPRSTRTPTGRCGPSPTTDPPAVLLVVGVNGSGKTTTCGKIARVLVADGRTVVLGAADTFRAAAADQLTTWASRVGADVVRGPEGGDPAAVAFDAVKRGIETETDTVLIDTAGRLQNKVGLMDELAKVKRVVERHGPVDETLLVLDATTGQNGLQQARIFTDVVNVTGVVLTKLDGTAKGGIVIAVQRDAGYSGQAGRSRRGSGRSRPVRTGGLRRRAARGGVVGCPTRRVVTRSGLRGRTRLVGPGVGSGVKGAKGWCNQG